MSHATLTHGASIAYNARDRGCATRKLAHSRAPDDGWSQCSGQEHGVVGIRHATCEDAWKGPTQQFQTQRRGRRRL
jgi:hypothetical protein